MKIKDLRLGVRLLTKVIVVVSIFGFYNCEDANIETIKINDEWKFKLLEENDAVESDYHLADFNDADWDPICLPHTANLEPLVVNNQWQGICWYRKELKVPASFKDKKLTLEFEAAMNHSKIWINGMEVATHLGGYLPVVIDASKYLEAGKVNKIAVRLNNTDNPLTGPKPLKILDFNMYGGLYRNAWLKAQNKIHISHPVLADKTAGGGVFITYPRVSESESVVKIKTHVVNDDKDSSEVKVVHSIFYDGELIKEQTSNVNVIEADTDFEFVEEININDAKLWSPKAPNLYQVATTVYANNQIVDSSSNRFGIREFTFKDNQLYINGEKTFLRGVNRHQDYPFIGYALSDNAQYRDAKKIKEAGFDYIRLSHYPHSPAFMDACDELGLVVVDAILGWQYYLDNDQFRAYCYKSAKELIYRDRNHPCVLAWEVSLNETKMPVFFMEELNKIVHEQYPGDNVYSCGWMNDVYDIFFQARQHRLLHPERYDESKPYSVSEYGDWEYYSNNAGLNQHSLSRTERYETSSRQKRGYGEARLLQQALNLQESHNDNFNTTAYADSYWVMYDYNRGYHDDIEYSGVMDIFRLPKFGYYFYKSQRDLDEEKVLHIATYWTKESPLNVTVFSNCEEVALFLNDELVAKQLPTKSSISNNLKHPPFSFNIESFKPGTLKAIGYVNGKEVSEHIVKTPKAATKLKMWLDESSVPAEAGVNDVLFLYMVVVDENGTIVPGYSNEVSVEINGDAELMNQGSIEAEAGIATALIKIGKQAGTISVKATSNSLSGDFQCTVK
ncbi:glycoside hydrolase family 2 TIM barrel-domain containing protein [Seonamhaeicola maritimus]|uniref:Glycoside hydrolase family 2 protein n=1 Tax=Seonamhaeicola maritimus TaxID=2591822 RepID=A0A5C7GMF6_9FLAO|nr:glycoside hydrolase family 2 TIM barrel-domain containing protein [Seonamhaeicola maritimus]TXG39101.1 glycoside hydrolase family 2 protein [Seonamhaeicola maritimus]